MLDHVVHVHVRQVHRARLVVALEEVGRAVREERRERAVDVVRLPDRGDERVKGHVAPVARDDAVVGHGVEPGARAAAVARAGRGVRGPVAACAGAAGGDDGALLEGGREGADEEEEEVPELEAGEEEAGAEEGEGDGEDAADGRDEEHGWCGSSGGCGDVEEVGDGGRRAEGADGL